MAVFSRLLALPDQFRAGLALAAHLRRPLVSVAATEALIRGRMGERENLFLSVVERFIFAHPQSPYRLLLQQAGYDLAGVRGLVHTHGLEGALDQLRHDGVYLRLHEFKGTEPVKRQGQVFRFTEGDFANPEAAPVMHTRSGASRSAGTEAPISSADLMDHARLLHFLLRGAGVDDYDAVVWGTPGSGLFYSLLFSVLGHPPRRWFSPVPAIGRSRRLALQVARLASGVPLPRLQVVPPEEALTVARYIHEINRRGVVVGGFVNSALRLVLAAEEAGISLGAVTFVVWGEPLTPAKRDQIESRGFRVLPLYGFSEFGLAAVACLRPVETDDYHVISDRVVLRTYSRPVGGRDGAVPAFLFTSLLPHARHVLLNVEAGDYGVVESRRCGCPWETLGLTLHVHTIRSFEKLTAEGVTFIGPSLIDLLEEILPREFGGDSRHYQLVEAEDERGFTRLFLLVSPEIGPLDEEALRRRALTEIGRRHAKGEYGHLVEQIWEDADTLQVLRRAPLTTSMGKIQHLHRHPGRLG